MLLRTTNSTLTIERAVSTPAQHDADGNVVVQPVHTTEYVGGIHACTAYGTVPDGLLAKLDDAEKEELKEALKDNEPRPDRFLDYLHRYICRALIELPQRAQLATEPEGRRVLHHDIMRAEVAWRIFIKKAKNYGLKPTGSRAAKKSP